MMFLSFRAVVIMAVLIDCAFAQTVVPTASPTGIPTSNPTAAPTPFPTGVPTPSPTNFPTRDIPSNNPLCEVCGPDFIVGLRNALVTIPDPAGTFVIGCGQFEQAGFDGYIPEVSCPSVPIFVSETCACKARPQAKPYCNVCGLFGTMTLPNGKAPDGKNTVPCSFYQKLGEGGQLENCDAETQEFLDAKSNCGCIPPPSSNPVCNVCPSGFALLEKETLFEHPSLPGNITCGDYEKAGVQGLVPISTCAAASAAAVVQCGGCIDITGDFDECKPCGAKFVNSLTASITLAITNEILTCGAYLKRASLGFIAPDVCDANMMNTINSCGCADVAPTKPPTMAPTKSPTMAPSAAPTTAPSAAPTAAPSAAPTSSPTPVPSKAPTEEPTEAPTEEPTEAPTEEPTEAPTEAPTEEPTEAPTEEPTEAPTEEPTKKPTKKPTKTPTKTPTQVGMMMKMKVKVMMAKKTKKAKIFPLVPN